MDQKPVVRIAPLIGTTRIYMDQGVIYAIANLRGGGEYGAKWHREGNLTNKQNVFDDFAAVLHHMIDRKYTSSERLIITGGSNGGLLMGAADYFRFVRSSDSALAGLGAHLSIAVGQPPLDRTVSAALRLSDRVSETGTLPLAHFASAGWPLPSSGAKKTRRLSSLVIEWNRWSAFLATNRMLPALTG